MLLKIAFALGLVFFTGCFRVGMPEFVSSGGVTETGVSAFPARARLLRQAESREPFALVLQSPEPDADRDSSLGHQFLLGVFPFTRVFFQHGASSLVEETTAQVLTERGYRVLFAPSAGLDSLAVEVPLGPIVRPRAEHLRINAYDLLFVRLAGVSGSLAADFYAPESFEPLVSVREQIDGEVYRRQAQAPALAALAGESVRSAVEAALKKAPSARRGRVLSSSPARAKDPEASLWVLSPVFSRPAAPGLGAFIAASYGFDSVEALRPKAVLRIVQRGAESELARAGVGYVSSLAAVDEALPLRSIATRVTGITFDESSAVVYEAELSEIFSGLVQRTKLCRVREPQAEGVDGPAVVTLERAAGKALSAFLGLRDNGSGSEVSCS